MRALRAVKTPDALQLAIAPLTKCPVFLTNDRELSAIAGIRILTVQAYLPAK
jgi:predicted nucleic acid-binding protein